MYGDAAIQAAHTPLQGNLAIDPIPGREGQILKIALEDRFNPEGISVARPDYRLHITLVKSLIPAVVKSDGTIERYEVHFASDFSLFQTGKAAAVFAGSLRRTGSYNVAINANFATYEAEQDTTERTLKEMAEDYLLRLTAHFTGAK